MKIKMLSLFSGIGAFEKALENLDVDMNLINYCEIDKFASKAYSLIHGIPESLNLGDITQIDTSVLPNDIDLMTYGFPCQDISTAGKMKGFEYDGELTRSGLFFKALKVIEDTQPKFAIAENVKNLTSKKFTKEFDIVLTSLNEAGYKNYWKVLNAKDYGIPQNRERVFIVSIRKDIDQGFKFPDTFPLELQLKDMLEITVDDKYYISEKMLNYIQTAKYKSDRTLIQDGYVCQTLRANGSAKCIRVKNATKKGYLEAEEGDYVNLQFPSSKTRRGRVLKKVSGTLQTNDGNGVVIYE